MDAATLGIIASVIGVGIALAALILRMAVRLERRIDRAEDARQSDMRDLNARMDRAEDARQSDMREINAGQAELRERMAKLEGLLEGLREAITGRRAA